MTALALTAGMVVASPAAASIDEVWLWGSNDFGQLGEPGSGRTSPAVSPVGAIDSARSGRHHVIALRPDGSVDTWGWNLFGQIGDGTRTHRDSPVTVAGLSAIAVGAGHYHSLAVTDTGSVVGWGRNTWGQLAPAAIERQTTPVAIPGISGAVAVAGGREHSIALLADGTVMAWGGNDDGQLGTGDRTASPSPVAVPGLTNVVEIRASRTHNLAVRSDGSVWVWGDNRYGQLGDGTTDDVLSPQPLTGAGIVVDAEAFGFHNILLDVNERAWVIGLNAEGQLGLGDTTNRVAPVRLPQTGVVAIGAGRNHTVLVDQHGGLWGSGRNTDGQLGLGSTVAQTSMTESSTTLDGVVALLAGEDWSGALADTTPPPLDNEPPAIPVLMPSDGSVLTGGMYAIGGTATDDMSGVDQVDLRVRDRDTGLWMQPDGSFAAPYATFPATVASPGSSPTEFSRGGLTFPAGSYAIMARATDGIGKQSDWARSVVTFLPAQMDDAEAPTLTVTAPVEGSTAPAGPFRVEGEAADDVAGVTAVDVRVRDRDTGFWLQPDGTFAPPYAVVPATVVDPGQTDVDWSLDIDLAAGSYALWARATDGEGKQSDWIRSAVAITGSQNDVEAPTLSIVDPADGTSVPTGVTPVSGTAADDVAGVTAVDLRIRDRDTGFWLQPDGTFAAPYAIVPATLTTPGTTAAWEAMIDLAPGSFAVMARATDAIGKQSVWERSIVTVVGGVPDTTAPQATVDSLVNGAVLTSGVLTLSGSATDDSSGIGRVDIRVIDRNSGQWLQADGSFAAPYTVLPAEVASPGSSMTSWSFDVNLPPGLYAVRVRAVDVAGNIDASWEGVGWSVEPGG